MKNLKIKGKTYKLPIFLPDATRGITKSIDSQDLENCGIRGVVINTYHLMTSPGTEIINKFGGIKKFMNFDGLVVSDSGGWQVFSLIHRSNMPGKITNSGVTFFMDKKNQEIFTPRKSIQIQFELGSDIIICLDDFTPPDATYEEASITVDRTIRWAKASKREYEEQIEVRKLRKEDRPHIFAVVQGGYFKELRKKCADELIKIGFDGYGYGGYVVDAEGNLDLDLSEFVCNLLPEDKPKFALGFGKPHDIANLFEMGWDIFDCTLPTRDARHKRLVVLNKEPRVINDLKDKSNYSYVYIDKGKYKEDKSPISELCDCHTCKNYSKAYLRHLFKINDTTAFRLATIHNLSLYTKVIDNLT